MWTRWKVSADEAQSDWPGLLQNPFGRSPERAEDTSNRMASEAPCGLLCAGAARAAGECPCFAPTHSSNRQQRKRGFEPAAVPGRNSSGLTQRGIPKHRFFGRALAHNVPGGRSGLWSRPDLRARARSGGLTPRSARAQQATKDGLRQADGDQRCGLEGKSAQTKPSPTGRACFKTHLGGAPSEQKTPRIEWRVKRPAACYRLAPLVAAGECSRFAPREPRDI